jgi:hypothetical protein
MEQHVFPHPFNQICLCFNKGKQMEKEDLTKLQKLEGLGVDRSCRMLDENDLGGRCKKIDAGYKEENTKASLSILKIFFLVYNSCTRGFHCDISIYVYNLPGFVHPSIILPLPLSPFLNITWRSFSFPYSHMCRKYLNHFHLPVLFSFTLPLPLVLSP